MIKNFVFGGNYFARREFVLYINHSGKYIEISFSMKIPFPITVKIHQFFSFIIIINNFSFLLNSDGMMPHSVNIQA